MIGKTLSHYTILKKLGSGGAGDVYMAGDTRLNRTVALKMLPPAMHSDPERIRRLVQEAKMASALDHPNTATIYEIGEAEGTRFIAMEYVDGETLAAKVGSQHLNTTQILNIAIQIAEVIDAAHEKGIVHRDI